MPVAGEPVRLVRARHDACGTATRVRVPRELPAKVVRRVVCDACHVPFECDAVLDVGVVERNDTDEAALAPARAPRRLRQRQPRPRRQRTRSPRASKLPAFTRPAGSPIRRARVAIPEHPGRRGDRGRGVDSHPGLGNSGGHSASPAGSSANGPSAKGGAATGGAVPAAAATPPTAPRSSRARATRSPCRRAGAASSRKTAPPSPPRRTAGAPTPRSGSGATPPRLPPVRVPLPGAAPRARRQRPRGQPGRGADRRGDRRHPRRRLAPRPARYEVTLRVAGPYRYYLATTVDPERLPRGGRRRRPDPQLVHTRGRRQVRLGAR